ncbi:MAG TPA: hypothetical protein PK400_03525 [Phycisphaerales bacterium]|nr:hypothetical protein [Phycisphaerales bacterium]HRQ75514.1 hypothetical protein [Phycisphaerales bacterium]
MLDREACERRVYRLALLLTGNVRAAWRVIVAVVDAQPDLRTLDGPHMDRLTVLRSREIKPGRLSGEGIPARVAEAMMQLTPQQREAWVFARVYRLPLREMAKSMDCSTTATERHLAAADQAMTQALGDEAADGAEAMLDYSMTLDVPAIYRAHRKRTRTVRWVAIACAAILLAVAGISGYRWLTSGDPPSEQGESVQSAEVG